MMSQNKKQNFLIEILNSPPFWGIVLFFTASFMFLLFFTVDKQSVPTRTQLVFEEGLKPITNWRSSGGQLVFMCEDEEGRYWICSPNELEVPDKQ